MKLPAFCGTRRFIIAFTRARQWFEEIRNAYKILVGKPKGKRPLGRLRRRCEYNIKAVVREIMRGVVDWMPLAPGRDQGWAFANAVMNF
jgi:hypothetical protein